MDDKETVAVTTTKKRGSKSASIEANCTATKEEIGKIIGDNIRWLKTPIVKSDEECADRLDSFFAQCHSESMFATVEKMALALGTTRRTVWEWENGMNCSAARTHMIKTAKEILAAIDADLVQSGKIPQITYIFRGKNFYGMKDVQDVVLSPSNPLGDINDPEQLKKRYLEAAPDVDG